MMMEAIQNGVSQELVFATKGDIYQTKISLYFNWSTCVFTILQW